MSAIGHISDMRRRVCQRRVRSGSALGRIEVARSRDQREHDEAEDPDDAARRSSAKTISLSPRACAMQYVARAAVQES